MQTAVILDLGGVLLNIDYQAPVREFVKLGVKNFAELFSQADQASFFDDFDKGKISNEKFRDEIRNYAGIRLTDKQIDYAWNSILLDLPDFKMKLLQQLKQNYRLFLLSNTNNIHIPVFESSMEIRFGKNYFHSHFEAIYYSSQIGMRKPDEEIFRFVMKKNGLNPKKTVFIDDSIQHVEGARRCGIQAYHLDLKKEDLQDLLIRIRLI